MSTDRMLLLAYERAEALRADAGHSPPGRTRRTLGRTLVSIGERIAPETTLARRSGTPLHPAARR